MSSSTVAIVFPGQSSQEVGMLSELAMRFSLIQETFSEASEILKYDIWKLVQCGPIDELNKTYRAQPAILTASVAIWRLWRQQGGCIPKIMAGHSLGEYSALVCAGSIDLSDAVKLVEIRGILMQKIVPYGYGAMSVIIGLNSDIIYKLCKIAEENQVVSIACFNAPENIVIAGHKEAVSRVSILCKNSGAKYIRLLPISVPSHCILMEPMVSNFREVLEQVTVHVPIISVINNVDVRIEQNPESIRNALLRQLYNPVRWSEIIQYFMNENIDKVLEMGPGKVLSGSVRNSGSNIFYLSVNNLISFLKAMKID